ncbi:MBL fold metallo-hydrolase [Franconibacter pulveris 1160]|uniref:MBL fold metallo-hydrolase n=1 Tax=Franconibacter pulveris TaxID=435910 RepID=UPI0004646C67|nr:MBL fold metallo-hydrolase [Franconibacter pulveris]
MAWRNPWFNPAQPHHSPEGFRNLSPVGHQPGDVERWQKERKAQGLPHPPQGGYDAFLQQWWQRAEIRGEEDGMWWLGHASLLLRINGLYILTDPVFSRRASPLTFYGPLRQTPLALAPSELPALDAIFISHNHYDHLDRATVRQLHRRFPQVQFFVPLGLGRWFARLGIKKVTELDWWQSVSWQGLTVTCVPAQHWSMRTLWDRDRTLWCGWVAQSSALRFWFSGDTGYMPELLQIPERLGPLDAAAIPIGAYAPRWFMWPHHMDPENAVRLWQQLGRPLSVPIHWGVFELTDESLNAPPRELLAELEKQQEKSETFSPLKIGQYLSLPGNKL